MSGGATRSSRVICIPCSEPVYTDSIQSADEFRTVVDTAYHAMPELFPSGMADGYLMKDKRHSAKLDLDTRRIAVKNVAYTIRPSFAMPYMTGRTAAVEKALFLRRFSVPFWALEYVFGANAMHWYRMEQQLGHLSLVGTTVRDPRLLPDNLAADEKHTRLRGEKVYVATTVAAECILGASIASNAGEVPLTEAYGTFKEEATDVDPDYAPVTVNTDGWSATMNAWQTNYANIVTILCFLHVFIKLRDGGKKKFKEVFEDIATKLWNAYDATSKRSFSQRVRRLVEEARNLDIPDAMMQTLERLKARLPQYSVAYDYEGAHRTSNMLDRLMQLMDRHLFAMRYFHGTFGAAELSIRGWSLIYNFAPSCPLTRKKHNGLVSPAERLNGFRYSDVWLENLLISGSLQARYGSPPNPL